MANHTDSNPSLQLTKPVSTRVVEHSESKVGNQTETSAQIELVGQNGVRHIRDVLLRSVETNQKISRILTMRTRMFASVNDATPMRSKVETVFTDIDKGEIEGDYCWATIQSTVVDEDGIHKLPAHRIKRPLVSPYAGRTEQEVTDEVFGMITQMKF